MSALPTVVVIGAMKCATTALHRYLDAHPQISMSTPKETNFFIGADTAPNADAETWWQYGQWHRGPQWYASLFDAAHPVRGETSPGYTSPDHPEVAARMAQLIPDARLVYLVRDPCSRALSQYRHHRRDDTEPRPAADAILDPRSQYIARGRYLEQLRPFLASYDHQQILVVVQERLHAQRRAQLRRIYRHVGADEHWWDDALYQRWHVGREAEPVPSDLRAAVMERTADDLEALSAFIGDDLAEWHAG